MSLLKLLQEASTLAIPSLKKAMLKDKRAAILFKKDLTLDDIEDKDAFLATLKYWILNNESVRSFVAMRHDVKDLDKKTLLQYRSMRGKDLDANNLKWLIAFIQDVFKEHASVERAVMSSDLKRELKSWINTSGRYNNLALWAQRELLAIPTLRPDKRVVLYRGVLFKQYDLEEKDKYDGTLEVGNGLKFLRSIKQGTREVDLSWDRPSSWTYKKEVAERFAKFGPASSNYAATFQWLDRSIQKKHIDGALGYVISTFAEPDDILLDMNRLRTNINQIHGDESEVILKPGTYKAHIVKKYTVDQGEVNPDEEIQSDDSPLPVTFEAIASFDKSFKLPEVSSVLDSDLRIWSSDAVGLVKHTNLFKTLIKNSTTTSVVHAYDKLMEFYSATLKDLDAKHLKAEKHSANPELGRKVLKLKELIAQLSGNVKHSKFRTEKNSSGLGKKSDLSGEEYRATISPYDLKYMEKDLLTLGRISDSTADKAFTSLALHTGVQLPTSAKLKQFGSAKQTPLIEQAVINFFKKIDITKPEDKQEALKAMINFIRKAHRNYIMLEEIVDIKKMLGELND